MKFDERAALGLDPRDGLRLVPEIREHRGPEAGGARAGEGVVDAIDAEADRRRRHLRAAQETEEVSGPGQAVWRRIDHDADLVGPIDQERADVAGEQGQVHDQVVKGLVHHLEHLLEHLAVQRVGLHHVVDERQARHAGRRRHQVRRQELRRQPLEQR